MKKSEMIGQLIEIEKETQEETTITMNYIHYLEKLKRLLEIGDVDLK